MIKMKKKKRKKEKEKFKCNYQRDLLWYGSLSNIPYELKN